MAQGAFNVSRLIAELGLQNIRGDEMRVLETIQPTMDVGNLADVTPPHVAPTAIFGTILIGGVGTAGGVQIQSLAPGGGFIEWITFESSVTNAVFSIQTANPGLAVALAPGGQASRDPIVSIATTGNVAVVTTSAPVISQTAAILNFTTRPIFIPRGTFFLLQNTGTGAAAISFFGFGFREVPASEFVPS